MAESIEDQIRSIIDEQVSSTRTVIVDTGALVEVLEEISDTLKKIYSNIL
jgi:hypothetical protein